MSWHHLAMCNTAECSLLTAECSLLMATMFLVCWLQCKFIMFSIYLLVTVCGGMSAGIVGSVQCHGQWLKPFWLETVFVSRASFVQPICMLNPTCWIPAPYSGILAPRLDHVPSSCWGYYQRAANARKNNGAIGHLTLQSSLTMQKSMYVLGRCLPDHQCIIRSSA